MLDIDFLPSSVQIQVHKGFGFPTKVEPLSGLTDADVWRIRFADGSVVVKRTTNANEPFFYKHVGQTLAKTGVASPQPWFLEREAQSTWLVLEDIPQPFPRERWLADEEQLSILRRLHRVDSVAWRNTQTLYRPNWSAKMSDAALTWFPASVADSMRTQLEEWRLEAQPLFDPTCLISGDPNPLNWGLRQDGKLAHFDWERFGWGTPAIDLAITVPGLGAEEDYQAVATKYLQNSDESVIKKMSRRIRLAKAWAIVELLCNFHQRGAADEDIVSHLSAEFPKWFRMSQPMTSSPQQRSNNK